MMAEYIDSDLPNKAMVHMLVNDVNERPKIDGVFLESCFDFFGQLVNALGLCLLLKFRFE